jgi:hypothetical protein
VSPTRRLIVNGGPAFPTVFRNTGDLNTSAPDGEVVPPGGEVVLLGMSLRDYFAAHVLPAVYTHAMVVGCESQETIVAEAYELADSMLEERAK